MDYRYLGSIFRLFLTGVTIGYYPTPTTEMSAGRSWCTEVGGGCEAGSAVQGKRRGLCGAALFAGAPSEWPYMRHETIIESIWRVVIMIVKTMGPKRLIV